MKENFLLKNYFVKECLLDLGWLTKFHLEGYPLQLERWISTPEGVLHRGQESHLGYV